MGAQGSRAGGLLGGLRAGSGLEALRPWVPGGPWGLLGVPQGWQQRWQGRQRRRLSWHHWVGAQSSRADAGMRAQGWKGRRDL